MSDMTHTDEQSTDATIITPPKERKPRTPKAKPETVAFSSCHVRFAKAKGLDTTKAAKQNRSYIRSNFDTLINMWPELKAMHKANRDGNRYPQTIPSEVADMIVKRALPRVAVK